MNPILDWGVLSSVGWGWWNDDQRAEKAALMVAGAVFDFLY